MSAVTQRPAPITLTEAAADRIKDLMAMSSEPVLGLRLGVKNSGCSGYSYVMDYAKEENPLDEMVESHGVKVFIDGEALMFILGTEVDFKVDQMGSSFVFNNPNETDRCGCGTSFSVK